jgi:5-methylcytosine-specific restriction protein A
MTKTSSLSSVLSPVPTEDEARAAAPGGASNLSGRAVPEWIGRAPSTPVPPRVRVRVFIRDDGRCQCGCNRRITVGEKWQTDHRIALTNGGENRERNLFTLLTAHHKVKTRMDVAEKSKVARIKARHLGIKKPSSFACSKASPWRKKVNGQVERR